MSILKRYFKILNQLFQDGFLKYVGLGTMMSNASYRQFMRN